MNWFATELHCHTLHSDGDFTVNELIAAAKRHELDGIALTDHNTISGWAELPCCETNKVFPVLKGVEWTTFFGHMLVMDCPGFVDWRDAQPDTIDRKTSEILINGGLAGLAHPFELGSPMCTGCYWDYHVQKWENISFIEVWSESFPCVKLLNQRAIELWNRLLDKGYRIAATYGRDWHRETTGALPYACTYIGTENPVLTPAEMKNALRNGRTAISMGPKFTMEARQGETTFSIGSTLCNITTSFIFLTDVKSRLSQYQEFDMKIDCIRLITNGSRIIDEIPFNSNPAQIEYMVTTGWYRGELWGSVLGKDCCLALTSPFYCCE